MDTVQLAVIDSASPSIAITVPGIQGPAGLAATALTVPGTSYMLSSVNNNRLALFTASSGITAVVPSGLANGFNCLIVQTTVSGQVTVSGASGVTIRRALSSTKTAYQYAVASIIQIGAEEYLLSGELVA
jgi:hypothetical protein